MLPPESIVPAFYTFVVVGGHCTAIGPGLQQGRHEERVEEVDMLSIYIREKNSQEITVDNFIIQPSWRPQGSQSLTSDLVPSLQA